MGGNPVETKVEALPGVLAAAAGVPAPAKAGGLLGKAWRYRKLALILGGSGITLGGGAYGYKYFTAAPGKLNADTPAAVSAKPEAPNVLAPSVKGDEAGIPPVVVPVKGEGEAPAIVAPPIKVGSDDKRPAPATTFADTGVTLIEPPPIEVPPIKSEKTKSAGAGEVPTLVLSPNPGADKKPGRVDEPPDLGPSGKKKAPAETTDPFQSTGPVKTEKTSPATTGPAPLPGPVTKPENGKDGATLLRTGGMDPVVPPPPPPAVPDIPSVSSPAVVAPPMPKMGDPAAPTVIAPAVPPKMVEPPAPGGIPTIDIPPPPPPMKMGEPIVAPPPPGKVDEPPLVSPPTLVPSPKPDAPVVVPMKDKSDVPPLPPIGELPPLNPPGTPAKPPANIAPPGIPTIDVKIGPPTGTPAPTKKDSYSEDWHNWKPGDTYALISQEYYKDAKYAAALETYNREHRKADDKIHRVPDLWKLEELYPHLIKSDKLDKVDKPDRPSPPDEKPTGVINFEPVAPNPSTGRPAPPPAIPTSATPRDQYRVTAPAGETIREVARKALGDGDLWWKIGQLNPAIDPGRPIPEGTTLKLPK